jgi:chromosome segregation ATPase
LALDIRHALSASAPDSLEELREMLGSLEAQLVTLYEEKEHAGPTAASSDEPLTALYEDKQRLSARTIADLRASVDSLSTQLAEFYELRQHGGGPADHGAVQDTLASLTEQLHALYEEREQSAFVGTAGSADHSALLASLQSFEAQLHALYAERSQAAYGHGEAIEMVASLESQVAALLDERNELADQLSRASQDVHAAKKRARELVNAVLDQSFA